MFCVREEGHTEICGGQGASETSGQGYMDTSDGDPFQALVRSSTLSFFLYLLAGWLSCRPHTDAKESQIHQS